MTNNQLEVTRNLRWFRQYLTEYPKRGLLPQELEEKCLRSFWAKAMRLEKFWGYDTVSCLSLWDGPVVKLYSILNLRRLGGKMWGKSITEPSTIFSAKIYAWLLKETWLMTNLVIHSSQTSSTKMAFVLSWCLMKVSMTGMLAQATSWQKWSAQLILADFEYGGCGVERKRNKDSPLIAWMKFSTGVSG